MKTPTLLTNTSRWKIILAALKRSPTLRRSSNSVAVVEGVPPHALAPALFKRENCTSIQPLSMLYPCSKRSPPAILAVFSTRLKKSLIFTAFFCDFSLRSPFTLAIVPFGPGFYAEKHGVVGSRPASIRIGVERKIRRISILDGSQATEQNQGCGTHRRESRHSEENRRSLL